MMRTLVLGLMMAAALCPAAEWTPLFDGKTLNGWKASEAGSFKVAGGEIRTDGPRSHLFYVGPDGQAEFKNFELKADVMTHPGANSGIYFHTRFQPQGWPSQGFEIQVNNSYAADNKKTGSLYGIRNVYKAPALDDEWFQMHIKVAGGRVQVRVNDVLLVDHAMPGLGAGTFALQCHDPNSKAAFKNILLKTLPEDAREDGDTPLADATQQELDKLYRTNFPLVDYHVHLKGGWTIEQALRESRRTGIGYGIAVNCGKGFGVTDDAGAEAYFKSMQGQPVWIAMQAEGREWVNMFSRQTIAKFDYVFTDAMTWTDDNGKRMRLWIPEEVGEIKDEQAFMETLVNRITGILNSEPIDIYVNPTFLPDVIAKNYDRLWTPERMQRVIQVARNHRIAIEINNRYRLPSAAFIKLAKQAGVKFSFGTNNADPNLGRLEYSLEMIRECGLTPDDIFVPKPKR